ncbi:putative bifunctional diguanylate cyclase/phosphodiesterase [Paenibacillus sedimenti]|uniref:Bifunctional diguanylate cyclase/phosphodiesterase n=1 Tax=Paenibacillus sedimenti TaxID=2770274 RepID=A0A926KWL3_9BACL|nr:bifunctional diguanylate cyclase/phosphodiesterase [Paenibacillus sedimenti]MBD0383558.1 bifunctional diguanylate cyclase/phosphodiesterase [Paenibacillus sedimenti]
MKPVWHFLRSAASKASGALWNRKKVIRSRHRQELQTLIIASMRSLHQKKSASYSTLLFLDIDRFRQVNFSLGYESGDLLMQEAAARLTACEHCKLVVQSGDDEFLLLLHAGSKAQLADCINQVQHIFMKPFYINDQAYYINASIGFSTIDLQPDTTRQALIQADLALYAAKHTGKNKTLAYDSAFEQRYSGHMQMETELRQAINADQLMLYYQPRLELSTGNIICLEALVRWNHPIHGIITPNNFIPLAEESGLIVPLGEWVLRQACLQKMKWLEAGIVAYQVAVNISPRQFQEEAFAEKVIHIIEQTGIDPSFLEFEITESSIMHDMDKTVSILEKLCGIGISISIDDFGIGYSSLSHLRHFPIHCLKIDRSFVKNIHSNQNDLAITHAIIQLGHSLNLQVVAEGVEEMSQLEILKGTTCTTIQGYLLSPPVSVYDLENNGNLLNFHI